MKKVDLGKIKTIKQALTRFFKDESGQSTTEYILILSIVVMIAMKFKNVIGDQVTKLSKDITKKTDDAMTETN